MKLHDFATAPNPKKVRICLAEKGIDERAFVAGDRPTIADCTLYAGLRYGFDHDARLDLDRYRNVLRWYEQFGHRPSTRA
jgi:glutathione S-transferase